MFAANADHQVGTCFAAAFGRNLHKFTDALAVKYGKWIVFQDFHAKVFWQEFTFGVIATEAEAGLSQIVGAETKEFSGLGQFISKQCGTRQFNHGAAGIVEADLLFGHNFAGNSVNFFFEEDHFIFADSKRNFDLR
ncbi:hypothetical protein SDC9_120899 [bioreactor metagenome]|uniref:Uncharacterized protein n=1 Tax=bioreactor metagenome TaxID=1076179 RepID=A0A645CAG3_9ZZZZ